MKYLVNYLVDVQFVTSIDLHSQTHEELRNLDTDLLPALETTVNFIIDHSC